MLMHTHEARLDALRKQLAQDGLDGFVIPISDEHMSEYVGAYAQRLAWLTGCLLYTSPSPRDGLLSRMPSSA